MQLSTGIGSGKFHHPVSSSSFPCSVSMMRRCCHFVSSWLSSRLTGGLSYARYVNIIVELEHIGTVA